jgi:hypothetical protein
MSMVITDFGNPTVAGGGLSTLENLQIIQWQANSSKQDLLEFTVPWWELRVGITETQFIRLVTSTSSMRNMTLRTMFVEGENDPLVQDFKCDPRGRTKMITIAVENITSTAIQKEANINASKYALINFVNLLQSETAVVIWG